MSSQKRLTENLRAMTMEPPPTIVAPRDTITIGVFWLMIDHFWMRKTTYNQSCGTLAGMYK